MLRKKADARRGVTLVEMVIVLFVVGIVTGGIWVAAARVQNKISLTDAIQNVREISSLVRGTYTGFPDAPTPTVAQQITKGLLPTAVLNAAGTAAVNAWGGDYHLTFVQVAGRIRGVGVGLSFPAAFNGARSREICTSLVSLLRPWGTNMGTFAALSAAPPIYNNSQGEDPSHAFVNGQDVTALGPVAVLTALGAGTCTDITFYFPL